MKKTILPIATATLASFLSISCSSKSEEQDNGILNIGTITVSDEGSPGSLNFSALFFKEPALSLADLPNPQSNEPLDSCKISTVEKDRVDMTASISAGEVLTISSPEGTFGEITTLDFPDVQFYNFQTPESSPIPTGLVIDIPGDEFPAFAEVNIPEIETFVLTSHSSSEIMQADIDEQFTWQAGNDADAYIRLTTDLNFSTNGSDEKYISIDCYLIDDGSFEFTTEMQTQIQDAGTTSLPLDIGRQKSELLRQGDAVLQVRRLSGGV